MVSAQLKRRIVIQCTKELTSLVCVQSVCDTLTCRKEPDTMLSNSFAVHSFCQTDARVSTYRFDRQRKESDKTREKAMVLREKKGTRKIDLQVQRLRQRK